MRIVLLLASLADAMGCGDDSAPVPSPDAAPPNGPALPEGVWQYAGPTSAIEGFAGLSDVPLGGRVTGIVQHPTDSRTLFVSSTGAGLWRTRDRGATWEALLDQSAPALSVGAFAIDRSEPDTIWVGLGDPFGPAATGVLRSTDGGATWTQVVDRLGSAIETHVVAVAPSGSVLVATDAGLFRAPPGGAFVQTLPDAGMFARVGSVDALTSLGGPHWVAAAGLAGGGSVLARSDDDGLTWAASALSDVPASTRIAQLAGASNRVYALATDPNAYSFVALLRSDDGGASFHAANAGVTLDYRPINATRTLRELDVSYALGIDPDAPDRVVLAGVQGDIASSDGGASWQAIANSADYNSPDYARLFVHVDISAIWVGTIDGVRTLMTGGDGGLAAIDDRVFSERAAPAAGSVENYPADWRWDHEWTRHLPNLMLYTVGRGPTGDRTIAGLQDNGTIVSADGKSFTEGLGGDGFGLFVSPIHPEVATASSNGNHLRSTDGGDSWQDAETGLPTPKPYFEEPFTVFYAALAPDDVLNPSGESVITPSNVQTSTAVTGCVYLSTDAGAQWKSACGEVRSSAGAVVMGHFPDGLATVATHPRAASVWGAVTYSGHLYVTTDAGQHWAPSGLAPMMPGLRPLSLVRIAFLPGDASGRSFFAYGTGLYGFAPAPNPARSSLYFTSDGGATFAPVTTQNGLPGAPVGVLKSHPLRDDVLLAGTSVGVYVSEDGGKRWRRFGTGLPNLYVTDLDIRAPTDAALDIVAATYGRGLWRMVAGP